jgi:hypothetical protein
VRVLSLIHSDIGPTGVFGDAVRERGDSLTEWNIAGGAPPEPPESYDAVFLFGGGMHVDQEDTHPWLRDEDELIKGLLADKARGGRRPSRRRRAGALRCLSVAQLRLRPASRRYSPGTQSRRPPAYRIGDSAWASGSTPR